MKQNSKEKQSSIYIRKIHILETTKNKSTFFGTHISLVFFHTCLKYILVSKKNYLLSKSHNSKRKSPFQILL